MTQHTVSMVDRLQKQKAAAAIETSLWAIKESEQRRERKRKRQI